MLPHLKPGGALRPLAVTSPRALGCAAALPNVPTMAESGLPGFQALSWHGIVALAGTPAPVLATLSTAIGSALALPAIKERLAQECAEASSLRLGDFGRFVAQEVVT